jgi:hypothetical protein
MNQLPGSAPLWPAFETSTLWPIVLPQTQPLSLTLWASTFPPIVELSMPSWTAPSAVTLCSTVAPSRRQKFPFGTSTLL